jgi:hypothetical protein
MPDGGGKQSPADNISSSHITIAHFSYPSPDMPGPSLKTGLFLLPACKYRTYFFQTEPVSSY